jgi:two-component system copper resistance phosphate regulon response regulator CusR
LIARILIIEDENKTASFLKKGLTESGYIVDASMNGDEGLLLALDIDYDLIILDVMLPGRDGWSILSTLRQAGKEVPVLFLTASDMVQDRVKGLELGADDYQAFRIFRIAGQSSPPVAAYFPKTS